MENSEDKEVCDAAGGSVATMQGIGILPVLPGWYTFGIINIPNNSRQPQRNALVLYDAAGEKQETESCTGKFIAFRKECFSPGLAKKLSDTPVFRQKGHGPFALDKKQHEAANCLFERIVSATGFSYKYKDQLLANLLLQVVHFALKAS